jgi:hypothetical protein
MQMQSRRSIAKIVRGTPALIATKTMVAAVLPATLLKISRNRSEIDTYRAHLRSSPNIRKLMSLTGSQIRSPARSTGTQTGGIEKSNRIANAAIAAQTIAAASTP